LKELRAQQDTQELEEILVLQELRVLRELLLVQVPQDLKEAME
jgi:hypothetical protein